MAITYAIFEGENSESNVINTVQLGISMCMKWSKLTPRYISSGLVQNSVSPTPYVSPSKKDYEIMFQPLFDEYFNPPPCVVSLVLAIVAAPRAIDPAGLPSSTTIDQDISSASTSPTIQEIQSQVTHQDSSSEETTLQGFIPSNLHHLNQSFDTLTKLTKNHPLENVIGDHSRPFMRTRRSYFPPANTIPHHSRRQTTNVVEPKILTIVTMEDNRTMAQMLQAPIEGYEDTIVVPQINADNFKLKQTLINLVQHLEVPNTTIKLLLFPFSLEGEARIWLDKEPPRSILTWEDLVLKFINQFFPPSKTTYLRNEITNFLQKPNETFNEAWEHFKDLLCQCPHHGFSELHQLDTFYNALNPNDQDALDFAAGGNFVDKIPRKCLSIIESKSKVRYSRSRVTDVRANANAPLPSSSHSNSFDLQQIAASLEDKLDIRMNRFKKSLNDMKNSFITPTAPLKEVEELITKLIFEGVEFVDKRDTHSLLNAACKKALNLSKKGLLIWGEAMEASKRKRSFLDHKIQLLSKGSSEGSSIIPEVLDKPKDNSCCSSSLLS
nr:reverse transcriptase domain-containing protein [Tanacetum cinerariifolium]